MLNQESISYRDINFNFCKKLSCLDKFKVRVIYPIGNTGPDGKLLVRIAKCRNDKMLPTPNCLFGTGSSLFLLKGKLPRIVVNADPCFKNMMGGRRYYFTELSIYLLVNHTEIVNFMEEVFMKMPPYKCRIFPRSICNIFRYGQIVLARITGDSEIEKRFFGGGFNELIALRDIAGLKDANFTVEENDTNIYNDSSNIRVFCERTKLRSNIVSSQVVDDISKSDDRKDYSNEETIPLLSDISVQHFAYKSILQ